MSGIQKAYLEPEKGAKIPCLFNPVELRISKTNTWSSPDVAKQDAPNIEFEHGESGTLDVDLTLDTTDSGKAVTEYTDSILNLMKVDTSLGENRDPKTVTGRPPWVRFRWGRTSSFKAVVTSATINFNYFSSDGKPLRATVELKMKQFKDEAKWPLQNPTSQTPELHTIHTIRAGETLDRIAYQHYGDSTMWKLIAQSNRIIDPLDLVVGTPLQIPEQETATNAG